MGTFTSSKRVERNGFLVAFEGEEMTEAEAVSRGLIDWLHDGDGEQVAFEDMTKKQLLSYAESIGCELPKNADRMKNSLLVDAIAEFEKDAGDESGGDQNPATDDDGE